MIPGFNETIRYNGRIYHAQTEDLGVKKAQIVSQIFCDGQILHTEKADYSHLLDSANLQLEVKKLLIKQHRNLHRIIKQGQLPVPASETELPVVQVGPDHGDSVPEIPPAIPPTNPAVTTGELPSVSSQLPVRTMTPSPRGGFLADLLSDTPFDLLILRELAAIEGLDMGEAR